MMKSLLSLIGLILSISNYGQSSLESDTIYQTKHYSFHNNVWVNLHHFFYEHASNKQWNKLKEDGITFKEIGDSLRILNLTSQEKNIFDKGLAFYQRHIIDKDLLFSGGLLKWLQAQSPNQNITDTSLSARFTETLNELKPIYESHFWIHHKKVNNQLLNDYIDLIKKTENKVISKMENLSGLNWTGIVRVDMTCYGNWASAYSPADENIVISSIDPLMHSTLFIEFVFHESSHLLFPRSSPFRISLSQKATELKIEQPRSLWHAAMFYLSGLATKEALDEYEISHELIMKKKNVFERYFYNEKFRSILRDYYSSDTGQDEMAIQLIKMNE